MSNKKEIKGVIENSIEIQGLFKLNVKTIFNIENEDEKKLHSYYSLSNLSGKKNVISYTYLDDSKKVSNFIVINVHPSLKEESDIKELILKRINSEISLLQLKIDSLKAL
jgi:hypothetical protein